MESFIEHIEPPQKCELGYDSEKKSCVVTLPTGETIELIETTLTKPNEHDSYITGFFPKHTAMGEVWIVSEKENLTVKKVTIGNEVLFEAPTIH